MYNRVHFEDNGNSLSCLCIVIMFYKKISLGSRVMQGANYGCIEEPSLFLVSSF